MRWSVTDILVTVLLAVAAAAQQIPAGTVLPVMLSTTLDSRHDKPGQAISGRLKQDVALPDGSVLPKDTRVVGHIVTVAPATPGQAARLGLQFDYLVAKGKKISVSAHLRALASMNEVFEAKMPTNAWDDYGTSPSDWNTVQVGGAGVYRGSGQLIANGDVVGRATDYGAVTARLMAAPQRGCTSGDDERDQSLWIFSPWACGVYGLPDLTIAHTGRTTPVGLIELASNRFVRVDGGSGWLLRTEPASPGRQTQP